MRTRIPPESTTRKRPNPRCTHLDMAGDSTIVVDPRGQAWCEQCGEGKPKEPTLETLNEAAQRIWDEKTREKP